MARPLEGGDAPTRTASLIGIAVAISGNIVISLALNTQKLAHRRIKEQSTGLPFSKPVITPLKTHTPIKSSYRGVLGRIRHFGGGLSAHRPPRDTTPLKARNRSTLARYGAAISSRLRNRLDVSSVPVTDDAEGVVESNVIVEGEVAPREEHVRILDDASVFDEEEEEGIDDFDDEVLGDASVEHTLPERTETAYLKSRLWWLGFVLMNVGELGNFLSYAYAPASMVAPLGAFALIANCFFAPLILNEKFRSRDLVGLALCIVGVVTIVLGGGTSGVRLDPDGLIAAISQRIFIAYSVFNVVLVTPLALLSDRPIGHRLVWIDLGTCALFGGFTVLSTKGISTMLTLEWIQIYKYWITYPLLLVLVVTAILQIRYLNRALMKFDSKVVIPTQFVLFNFTAIIGSAVLYRDFEHISFERMVMFLYGCASTFLGVFVLARATDDRPIDEEPHNQVHINVERSSPSPRHPTQSSNLPTSSGANHSEHNASLRRGLPVVGPSLRSRTSSTSLGFSPGQYLLLATSGSPTATPGANGSGVVTSPINRQGMSVSRTRLAHSRSPSREREGRHRSHQAPDS